MNQKKIFFKNYRKLNLAGVIERAENEENPIWIVMVHGFTGNKDENGLFTQAAHYFTESGFSVFRFDMRGCGESEGYFSKSSLDKQRDDLLYALYTLRNHEDLNNNSIVLVGFSLGATVILQSYFDLDLHDILGFCFWSPALFPSRDLYPRYATEQIQNDLREKGFFEKSGLRVGPEIINDLRDCNLVSTMQGVKKPVSLIHGKIDERIDYRSTEIASTLFQNLRQLEIIKSAGHSFRGPKKIRRSVFSHTVDFINSIKS